MNAKTAAQQEVSSKLITHWEQVCRKIEALANEFPAQKFDWRPADGTRSTADVLRHVAFWNCYVADIAAGNKADDSANELSKNEYSTKAEILKVVKQSSSEATKALKAISSMPTETAEMITSFIEHNSEHYGQLVVYARLQGLVPPASRG